MTEENAVSREVYSQRPGGLWVPYLFIFILIGVVAWLFLRVDRLEKDLATTQETLGQVSSKLDYVAPLAENANNYAHSHPGMMYSDIRLKDNIVPIDHALEGVLRLQGVRFSWNGQAQDQLGLPDRPQIGLIAQDVEKVFPELVSTDPSGYKTIDYPKLTAVLVEAIKIQQQAIHSLPACGN